MPLDRIAERLLKAGVSPRHVRRYIRELHDHLEDLRNGLRASGYCAEDVERMARARLGDDTKLALAMLEQPGVRAWSARTPWLVFCVIPTMIALALFFLSLAVLKWASHPGGLVARLNIIDPTSFAEFAHQAVGASNLIIAPVISAVFAIIAARQRLHVRWALLAAVSIAVLEFQLWINHGDELAKTWLLSAAQTVLTLLPVAIPLRPDRRWTGRPDTTVTQ
jgi:hypothetical protein